MATLNMSFLTIEEMKASWAHPSGKQFRDRNAFVFDHEVACMFPEKELNLACFAVLYALYVQQGYVQQGCMLILQMFRNMLLLLPALQF